MNDDLEIRCIALDIDAANDLELLLRKLASASREDLLILHEAGLNECASVYADHLEYHLDLEREAQ